MPITTTDPDTGPIQEGHICKHGVRWPHECRPCADAAWERHQLETSNGPAEPYGLSIDGDGNPLKIIHGVQWAYNTNISSNRWHAYKDGVAVCGSPLKPVPSALTKEYPGRHCGCRKCEAIVFPKKRTKGKK